MRTIFYSPERSARVSIIGQLRKIPAQNSIQESSAQSEIVERLGSQSHSVMQTEIAEEDEDNDLTDNKCTKKSKLDEFKFINPEVFIFNRH